MKKSWAQKMLVDSDFIVLELYTDHGELGKDYIEFQEQVLLAQGAPHYAIINAKGELVADENDIQKLGVQTSATEDERKELFQEFLNKHHLAGEEIPDW